MVEYRRLTKDQTAVLMVDHQSGLVSLVQDFSPDEFKNNVLALAELAKYFAVPTILTTSFEEGPGRAADRAPRSDQRLGQR
jgi:nicotinamidase-related amidase